MLVGLKLPLKSYLYSQLTGVLYFIYLNTFSFFLNKVCLKFFSMCFSTLYIDIWKEKPQTIST